MTVTEKSMLLTTTRERVKVCRARLELLKNELQMALLELLSLEHQLTFDHKLGDDPP
jgi:hypothetical protein